jgi:hypothetical protein
MNSVPERIPSAVRVIGFVLDNEYRQRAWNMIKSQSNSILESGTLADIPVLIRAR